MRQDLRYALRLFRHNPAFAAMVIAIVALGVGVNTAMFSAIDAVVLKPLPFAEPERLAILWEPAPTAASPTTWSPLPITSTGAPATKASTR